MTNVISLDGRPPVGAVNGEVVEVLEELLARARAGSIVGLMYATIRSDGTSGNGWTNVPAGMSHASGLVHLNYRFGKELDG
jgi:hypothetical protein